METAFEPRQKQTSPLYGGGNHNFIARAEASCQFEPLHSSLPPMTSPQTKSTDSASRTEDHVAFIDYVRATAILLVVGFHLLMESFGSLEKMEASRFADWNVGHIVLGLLPFSYGYIGVAIFFLVSGFCIHLSHARSKQKGYKVYFSRRFFRIYPPYFVALIFFTFVFPYTLLKLDSRINVFQFVSHVLMVQNLDPRSFYGINGTFWTVAVEVQLYCIYPLLLLFVRRLGWNKALLITGVIEMSIRGLSSVANVPYAISASPFFYWFSWSIGAKLADDYLYGRRLFLAGCPIWVWPCLGAVVYSVKPLFVFLFPCVSLSTAAVVAYFMSRPAARMPMPQFLCNALRQTGAISYSIYLLHGPLLAFLPKTIRAAFPAHEFSLFEIGGCLLLFCVPVFVISWLSYRFVELPSIGLGKWVIKKMSPSRQAPVLATPDIAAD